jgi:medium-chain acyl-[acyl-carrier-protein] hydrolase
MSTLPGTVTLTLFCLPHAGGTARHFARWNEWLPSGVTAIPVDLPGHGTRHREVLVDGWPSLIDDLSHIVDTKRDGPYALVGHSLGALAAFEVARTLEAAGDPPSLLVAVGRNGPSAGISHRPMHTLPDAALLEAVDRLGGTPGPVARDPAVMRFFLPAMRTDLRLAETYVRAPGPPLSCPIWTVCGRRDRMTELPAVLAWQRETTATFELTLLDAGHFLLDEPEFVAAARRRLSTVDSN